MFCWNLVYRTEFIDREYLGKLVHKLQSVKISSIIHDFGSFFSRYDLAM